MRSLRGQRAYLLELDALERRTTLPAHLLDRNGRLPPPLDLAPGFRTLCMTCAVRAIDERCSECPRRSSELWRRA